MKISVQTGGIEEHIGIDACYRMIREAGFDAVDVNLDHLLPPPEIKGGKRAEAFEGSDEEILAYFRPWKEAAEKYGLDNYQAHAPFSSYVVNPTGEYNAYLMHVLEKTIMGCESIGCRRLIIHPFFLGYPDQVDEQAEWETNISRYAALIPAAKRYGVTICLENMFKRHKGKIYAACCSNIDTACRYVDALNEMAGGKVFAFCLDTGHSIVRDTQPGEAVRMGAKYLKVLHVHDSDGQRDRHWYPGTGAVDWDDFTAALKEVGYAGVMSLETRPDADLTEDQHRLEDQKLAVIARKLADQAE